MANFTPSSRSLVLRHGELGVDLVLIRQENDGRLFITIAATAVSELQTPGLLRCTHNTLIQKDLKGTYHYNDLEFFICKELLDITQHDTATPALGRLLEAMYLAGDVLDVELARIDESMVVANEANEEVYAVFFVDSGVIKLCLLTAPTSTSESSQVLHNDMPVDSQADLLRFSAGGATEHFSLFDFMYDVKKGEVTTPRVTAKLHSLFVGAGGIRAVIDGFEIRKTGVDSVGVTIPLTKGNLSQEEALKNIMNPPSTALQYRVTGVVGKSTFIEPLRNRKEIIIQTDKAIRVGWGDDNSAAAEGFLVAGGGATGCSIGTHVSMSIQPVSENANVFILQLGV
jgi:hypothetical protein